MDMKTDTTVTPLKRFLVALPIFDETSHRDRGTCSNEPDDSLPWLTPHAWLFTIRAPGIEGAIDAVYDLIVDQKRLADLHGGLCFDTDESGNEVRSLSYNGYFVGNPQIVEVLGELVGAQEVECQKKQVSRAAQ